MIRNSIAAIFLVCCLFCASPSSSLAGWESEYMESLVEYDLGWYFGNVGGGYIGSDKQKCVSDCVKEFASCKLTCGGGLGCEANCLHVYNGCIEKAKPGC